MGMVEGYLAVGKKGDIKHYFLPSIEIWTPDFKKVSLADIKAFKIEIDMSDYPIMDKEYTHEKIEINGNFYE